MERQSHGFAYEGSIIQKHNLTKETAYNGEWDAYWQNGKPVQIKAIKFGSAIDLGDYFRNKSKSQNFTLFISFWKGTNDNIVEEYVFENIDCVEWNKMFEYEFDDELRHDLDTITNDYSDDKKWKDIISKHKSRWNQVERLVQPRFKRDHKNQKRMQCAINTSAFKSILEKFNGKKA
jgi:hypothetical protein